MNINALSGVTSATRNAVEGQVKSNRPFTCSPSFDCAADEHGGSAQDGGNYQTIQLPKLSNQ